MHPSQDYIGVENYTYDSSIVSPDWADDRGQIAVLAAVLVALLMGIVVAVAIIGQAMIERSNATIAADAIALASVSDPASHDQVARWYRSRGFGIGTVSGYAAVSGDQATARSYAIAESELRVAPVLVAVLARAEQLVGHEFGPLRVDGTSVLLHDIDAAEFGPIAAELGMCHNDLSDTPANGTVFQLC